MPDAAGIIHAQHVILQYESILYQIIAYSIIVVDTCCIQENAVQPYCEVYSKHFDNVILGEQH